MPLQLSKVINTLCQRVSAFESGNYSGKWQATDDLPTCRSCGGVVAHISWAFQHLVLNRQPDGGLIGFGTSPVNRIRSLAPTASGSASGTADSKAFVYGCFGFEYRESRSAISTIFPKYITATRWAKCLTTARSWAIKINVRPNLLLKRQNKW